MVLGKKKWIVYQILIRAFSLLSELIGRIFSMPIPIISAIEMKLSPLTAFMSNSNDFL